MHEFYFDQVVARGDGTYGEESRTRIREVIESGYITNFYLD